MSANTSVKWAIGLGIVLSLGSTACDGAHPERRDVRYFAPFQTVVPKPQQFQDQGPQLTDTEKNVYEPIVEGFQKNHRELLKREDISGQLERIENVYVEAGRYLDLYAIYQEDYRANGVASPAAERLAWGSIRLGQQQAAKDLIDELIAKKPSATAHFLEGAYWLQLDPTSPEGQAKTVAAWRKTLALDPRFRGFESITAAMIAEQVARMEAVLAKLPAKPDAVAPVDAAKSIVEGAPMAALSEVAPSEAVAVAPEPVAPVEAVEAPPVAPVVAELDKETQYRIAIARGEMLASDGKLKAAEDAFIIAKSLKPDGFEAEFGQLKTGWGAEGARAQVSRRMRTLASREGLSARQSYDIGLFVFSKMNDRALAREMFEKVKTLDPALAKQVGIDALLASVGN
jgi:tetratricopeptide (TPR) repeat protein